MPAGRRKTVSAAERLERKIQYERKNLERLHTQAERDDLTIEQKETLNEQVDRIFDLLNGYYNEALDTCDDTEVEGFEQGGSECSELWEKIKAKIRTPKANTQSNAAAQPATTTPTQSSTRQDIRLPKVELGTFQGNLTEWSEFFDLFSVTINDRSDLTKTAKFQYLKGALKGEAAEHVSHLKITDGNYDTAIQILKENYENQREIIYAHVRTLLELKNDNLKQFVNNVSSHVRALDTLSQSTKEWDAFLNVIVLDRLDADTKEEFEMTLTDQSVPPHTSLMAFLRKKVIAKGNGTTQGQSSNSRQGTSRQTSSSNTTARQIQCLSVGCREKHFLHRCDKFKGLNVKERKEFVYKHHLCPNCFSPHHRRDQCTSSNCRTCAQKHHTLLHYEKEGVSANCATNDTVASNTLLPTALIQIEAANNELLQARSMLDPCAQTTLVSEKFLAKAKLKKTHSKLNLSGVTTRTTAKGKVEITLHSLVNQDFSLKVTAFVVRDIGQSAPSKPINIDHWQHIQALKLADPSFNIPGEIDILLGVDVWAHIIQEGILRGSADRPIAQATSLGWIVLGKINDDALGPTVSINPCFSVEQTLTKFWELEAIPEQRYFTPEEKTCDDHYKNHTKRLDDGRYQVTYPLIPGATLGESKNQAMQRFVSLERKMEQQPELKKKYSECISEYLTLGHMQPVPKKETTNPNAVYLPHHAVFKESTTTKLRVVFDASARTTNGKSLNDVMLNGPVLQDDLFTILVRFRTYPVVLVADLEKMYRQILVDHKQTDLQRIVWREHKTDPLQHLRLTRLTFGTKAAPYLAVKTIHQLCNDEEKTYPIAATKLKEDMYVDDLHTGAETTEAARLLRDEASKLAKSGGFTFRKWASNKPEVLDDLPNEDKSTTANLELSKDGVIKTLGLQWRPTEDVFLFDVRLPSKAAPTKRSLLSDASRIFDPLGFLAPVTIKAKILFQQLWLLPLSWDDPLPADVRKEWQLHQQELSNVGAIKIERLFTDPNATTTLCGFSDASEKAYSAVVYARSQTPDNNVSTTLIAAKTRVAPLKTITLPRLELCGALLLSRLMENIRKTTGIAEMRAWTDSTVVLAWLSSPPSAWKTFIANRTAEIQETVPRAHWHHVKGEDNPADCASRGISPSQLIQHKLWWHGPSFLHSANVQPTPISKNDFAKVKTAIEREKKKSHPVVNVTAIQEPLFTSSSFRRLIRVTAYIQRFCKNLRARRQQRMNKDLPDPEKLSIGNRPHPLTVDELQEAELYHLKRSQAVAFKDELQKLQQGKPVHRSSTLRNLTPFLDEKGLIRVGGRLENSCLSTDGKHPVILSADAAITEALIRQFHRDFFHANTSLLLNFIQHRYWLPGTRKTINKVIRRCVTCIRYKAEIKPQLMADLPESRVVPMNKAFDVCGVDYAGPFSLKQMNKRSTTTRKGYVAIFVCFATRAAHIEVVSDMSTPTFIAALRRFISRRGKPSTVHSDCGTNFVGADRELRKLLRQAMDETHDEQVAEMLASLGIEWQFNPPKAPHFGGLWEAAVKSFKYHLKRVVGETILNFEEFTTLASQIEALLNSRPLCSKSADPNKFEALTPGHFLIGSALIAPPEPTLTELPKNHLSRWQLVQAIQQSFWRRWKNEYLLALQRRYKWTHPRKDIETGQIVLIKDQDLPPSQWELGRITTLHPGKDQLVRVVTVKTAYGERKRPIVKLIPLLTS